MKIVNNTGIDLKELENKISEFYPYSKKTLGFDRDPNSINLVSDPKNASNILGKTAFYSPGNASITVYTDKRHPKDILRSISHELVHHAQNCRGEFSEIQELEQDYAQTNKKLREMEQEAYLMGNMTFRDWEDGVKFKMKEIKMTIEEKNLEELEEGVGDFLKKAALAGAIAGSAGGAQAYDGPSAHQTFASAQQQSAKQSQSQSANLSKEQAAEMATLYGMYILFNSRGPDANKPLAQMMRHAASTGVKSTADLVKYFKTDPYGKQALKVPELKDRLMKASKKALGAVGGNSAKNANKWMNLKVMNEYNKKKIKEMMNNIITKIKQDLAEAEKPDFLDVDKDGDKEEPMSKAADEKKDDGEEKSDKDMSKVPPQLRKHVAKKMDESESIEEGSCSSDHKREDDEVDEGSCGNHKREDDELDEGCCDKCGSDCGCGSKMYEGDELDEGCCDKCGGDCGCGNNDRKMYMYEEEDEGIESFLSERRNDLFGKLVNEWFSAEKK